MLLRLRRRKMKMMTASKHMHRKSWTLLALFSLSATQVHAQERVEPTRLVLTGVTVVDTHTGSLTPNQSIAMEHGKIIQIGAAGTIVERRKTTTINATGKFVVPGFWNMHAHEFEEGDPHDNLTLLLAYGITGFRQMSGSDKQLSDRKAATLVPDSRLPELLAMPGEILTRLNAATPEQAASEIKKQRAEGADFIKTIDLTPELFFAVAADARNVQLPFGGHLTRGVDAVKASQAGMRSIEHMGPNETLFISCSTVEARICQAIADHPGPNSIPKNMTPEQFKLIATNAILTKMKVDPQFISGLPALLATYDGGKCGQVAKVFIEHQTWLCPTLIRERTSLLSEMTLFTKIIRI